MDSAATWNDVLLTCCYCCGYVYSVSSGDALAQFERHKFYPAYVLVALALMEALRQRYSTTLHRARLRRQHQYEMLA